ncbi:VOC family protein [Paramicrobacterium fandaimingii]|uniref:VOC family protein n=1 Tax=Paramicrobacterium fandaimingii TaxID=2708079 RepID=UPI0030B8CB54
MVQMRLELIPIPVSDIDTAKDFYVRAGFNADHDIPVSDDLRFVQLTPPGSACSIVLDVNMTEMNAGSRRETQCVIDNAEAARDDLRERGIDVSDVDEQPWGRFVYFSDPDGNTWALQQAPEQTGQSA